MSAGKLLHVPHAGDLRRAALAGVLGSCAYVLEMWLDLRLVRYRFNDLLLLGRPFGARRSVWSTAGAGVHLLNGGLMGCVFALVRGVLPGPGWVRGILFAQIENLALWPLMLLVDRYHPARREGELAPGWSRRSYLVAFLRHLAFGAALGVAYRPEERRP